MTVVPVRTFFYCTVILWMLILGFAGCDSSTTEQMPRKSSEVSTEVQPSTKEGTTDTNALPEIAAAPEEIANNDTAKNVGVENSTPKSKLEDPLLLLSDPKYIEATEANLEPLLREHWDGTIKKNDTIWSFDTGVYSVDMEFDQHASPPRGVKVISIKIPGKTRLEYLGFLKNVQTAMGTKPEMEAGPNYIINQFDLCRDRNLDVRYSWNPVKEEKLSPILMSLEREPCYSNDSMGTCDNKQLSSILFVAKKDGVSLQSEPGEGAGQKVVRVPFNQPLYPRCKKYVYHGKPGYREWIQVRWKDHLGWLEPSHTSATKEVASKAFTPFADRFIADLRAGTSLTKYFANPVRFNYQSYDRTDGNTNGELLLSPQEIDKPFTLPLFCDDDGWIDEEMGRKHVSESKRYEIEFDLKKRILNQLEDIDGGSDHESIIVSPYYMSIAIDSCSDALTFYFVEFNNNFIGWKVEYNYEDPG